MNKLLRALLDIAPLSSTGVQSLSAIIKRDRYPKGYRLVKERSVSDHVYFVENGLTRTYYVKDGKEITDWLSPEGTFACSIISYVTRKTDRRIIELLEPSIICSLPCEDLQMLFKSSHELEHLGHCIVKYGMVQMQKRFDSFRFSTAMERYQALMDRNPSLIQRVPLGIIASYLGMSQETLSRIRSQLTEHHPGKRFSNQGVYARQLV